MHGVVFQPINMKNEQNITGSNTLTEDTPAPADSTPNTPGGTKTAKKMTRRVLIGGGIGTLAVAGVGAGWAYNRYLAEHTQIEDTLAYEAAQQNKNNPSGAADPTELTGATVITHPVNLGKGAAIRTGLNWARIYQPRQVVVTADSDGQHLVRDILRVGAHTATHADSGKHSLVLGVRTLPDNTAQGSGTVPARSKVGNAPAGGRHCRTHYLGAGELQREPANDA